MAQTTNLWPVKRLKFAATINDETLTEETPPDFEIQYVDIGNVGSDGSIEEIATYRFENAPSRARRIVRDGDVIISTVRTYLQAIASIENPAGNLIVSTGFAVIRPKAGVLNPHFCKYAIREPEFLAEVIKRSVGISYPAINASEIGDIPVPIPPLTAQRAIADYLDRETERVDALLAEKGRLLGLLVEKRRAIITRAVTHGLNPGVPLRDSGLPWLGLIPEHWEVKRLKHVTTKMEQGWSPQCESFPASEGEWGVLKAGCVNGPVLDENENKRLPDSETPIPELEIKSGDILMSRANTTELLGSCVYIEEVSPQLILCDKLYRFHPETGKIAGSFLVHFLRAHPGRFVMEREASGASNSMQNIGQETVKNLFIPVPPLPEQRAIVTHIATATAKLDKLRASAERTIALLKERRAALIAAAVTGRIAIPATPA